MRKQKDMTKEYSQLDLGLLILRLVLGIMFLMHGYPKISGGPDTWLSIGETGMAKLGISFWWMLWGFLAAVSEFFGGLFLIFGFMVRISAFFLFFTMCIAASHHLLDGDGIMRASHAIESGAAFLFLIFSGGGFYSLDYMLSSFIRNPWLRKIFSVSVK